MSKTLNIADQLLGMSRNMRDIGRDYDATSLLTRLCRFQELPLPIAEEAQSRLAESYLEQRKYRKARRLLTAAMSYQPNNARYHYLMARAFAEPDDSDTQRAADHYRKALELDPDQPDCLSDNGLLCLRLGQIDEGLQHLRRAVELAPHEPQVLQKLVDGLEEVEQFDEAQRAIQAALFRNSRDARFRQIWKDHQFQRLWRDQLTRKATNGSDVECGPAVLPFVRPTMKIVRHDAPAALESPHAGRGIRVSRRQAR